jgi:S1 RNA binding domain protein
MDLEVGAIVAGKVTGITNFGAFVTISPGKSGLVHISEIAATYVNNVRDHLAEGQDVMVKIIGVDQTGRLNLSIKAALAAPEIETRARPQQKAPAPAAVTTEPSFEDRLKRFMQDSDNKISGLKQYSDKKGARRRSR